MRVRAPSTDCIVGRSNARSVATDRAAMDSEVDESLREFMDDSVWDFFFRDATASPDTVDEFDALFRELPMESLTAGPAASAAGGGRDPDSAECSVSKFRTTSDEELKRLVSNNYNSNTAASTKNWLRRFQKWAAEKDVASDITTIPREELDQVLQHFYAELMKKDGQEYEPESLKVMIAALDRHVREKCGYSILKDKDFEQSRLVLNGKAIELQKQGKGKKPRRADALTEEEEQAPWSTVLGQENPKSLNYTIFFLFGQHFGTRGRQEHHQIQIEDLKQIRDPAGNLVQIEWIEGPTKTRQGGLNRKPRAVTQKLFRIGGSQCPIACFEKLLQKRPPGLQHSGPLYLTPLRKERDWTKAPVWFSKIPLGIHSIDTLMKSMAEAAGLDVTRKRYTNHSIRKTTVRKLRKGGASSTEIIAITGHKNQQSLVDYDELDENDHLKLGKILSKPEGDNICIQLPCAPHSSSTNCYSQPPIFNIQYSNVYFGASSSNMYSQQYSSMQVSKKPRRAYIIDSDSD